MIARFGLALSSMYLGAAVMGRVLERRGMLTCDCRPGCWCKRPVLSVFRWVVPRWHDCC